MEVYKCDEMSLYAQGNCFRQYNMRGGPDVLRYQPKVEAFRRI